MTDIQALHGNPIKNYEWWHDAVFRDKPIRDTIPEHVLRAYLDALGAEHFDNKTRVKVLR